QVRVKIARLRIDLRYQRSNVEIRRGKIKQQFNFFSVAPPPAGARRSTHKQSIHILKVDARFVDLDLAIQLAKRLEQRLDQHLDVHQIQIADKLASHLGIERP